MASTARSYMPQRRYEREAQPTPRIEVHKGRDSVRQQNARMVGLFKAGVVVVALFTLVAVGRIWLTDASMDTLTQASAVEQQVAEATEANSRLEVQYHALTSPSRVQSYASESLGMIPVGWPDTVVALAPGTLEEAFPQVSAIASDTHLTLTQQGYDSAVAALNDFERTMRAARAAEKAAAQEAIANHEALAAEASFIGSVE